MEPDRIGVYIQPQHQGVSQHVEFTIPYDAADRKEADAAKRFFLAASEELIAQGAYFSRPYGPWADLVYSRDATATRVLRTVKQIVDPNDVMNPGKLCYTLSCPESHREENLTWLWKTTARTR